VIGGDGYNWSMARTMNPVHEATTCAVAASAEIIGAKWTALLVHDLSEGARRFSQLEHSCGGISPRTLAERLRALESEGIVERHSYPESPPRVEYSCRSSTRCASSGTRTCTAITITITRSLRRR
jgi:DNA-binding HxlR family transcriptional regulator